MSRSKHTVFSQSTVSLPCPSYSGVELHPDAPDCNSQLSDTECRPMKDEMGILRALDLEGDADLAAEGTVEDLDTIASRLTIIPPKTDGDSQNLLKRTAPVSMSPSNQRSGKVVPRICKELSRLPMPEEGEQLAQCSMDGIQSLCKELSKKPLATVRKRKLGMLRPTLVSVNTERDQFLLAQLEVCIFIIFLVLFF